MFEPTVKKERVTDITAGELQALGVKGLLLDVDNTLTTHDSQQVSQEVQSWLAAMREAGVRLIIVSNARESRVAPFAATVGLPFVWKAAKPLGGGFRRAMRQMGLKRQECLVVGDQLFTDLLGAKWSGIRSLLLTPIALEKGRPFMMFKRRLEKWLMK